MRVDAMRFKRMPGAVRQRRLCTQISHSAQVNCIIKCIFQQMSDINRGSREIETWFIEAN